MDGSLGLGIAVENMAKQQFNNTIKWDKYNTLKLIEMFEMRPELWNKALKEYRDREKKAKFTQEIADTFDISKSEIGRKWHNLRCQLNSEIRKIRRKNTSGNELVWTSNWEFFEPMRFMFVLYDSTQNSGNPEYSLYDAPFDSESPENSKMKKIIEKSFYDNSISIEEPELTYMDVPYTPSENTSEISKVKKISSNNTTEKQGKGILKKVLNRSTSEYAIFGKYVASELRQLHSDKNRRQLKRIIQKAILDISEQDEREFSHLPATSTVSPSTYLCDANSNDTVLSIRSTDTD